MATVQEQRIGNLRFAGLQWFDTLPRSVQEAITQLLPANQRNDRTAIENLIYTRMVANQPASDWPWNQANQGNLPDLVADKMSDQQLDAFDEFLESGTARFIRTPDLDRGTAGYSPTVPGIPGARQVLGGFVEGEDEDLTPEEEAQAARNFAAFMQRQNMQQQNIPTGIEPGLQQPYTALPPGELQRTGVPTVGIDPGAGVVSDQEFDQFRSPIAMPAIPGDPDYVPSEVAGGADLTPQDTYSLPKERLKLIAMLEGMDTGISSIWSSLAPGIRQIKEAKGNLDTFDDEILAAFPNWADMLTRTGGGGLSAAQSKALLDIAGNAQKININRQRSIIRGQFTSLSEAMKNPALTAGMSAEEYKTQQTAMAGLRKQIDDFDSALADVDTWMKGINTAWTAGNLDTPATRSQYGASFEDLTRASGAIGTGEPYVSPKPTVKPAAPSATEKKADAVFRGDPPIPGDPDYIPPELSGTVTKADPKEVDKIRAQEGSILDTGAFGKTGVTDDQLLNEYLLEANQRMQSPVAGVGTVGAMPPVRDISYAAQSPESTWVRMGLQGQLPGTEGRATTSFSQFAQNAMNDYYNRVVRPGYAMQLAQSALEGRTGATPSFQFEPGTGLSNFEQFMRSGQAMTPLSRAQLQTGQQNILRALADQSVAAGQDPYRQELAGLIGTMDYPTAQNINLLSQPVLGAISPTFRSGAASRIKSQLENLLAVQPERQLMEFYGAQPRTTDLSSFMNFGQPTLEGFA